MQILGFRFVIANCSVARSPLQSNFVLHWIVATPPCFVIMRPARLMKRIGLFCLAVFLASLPGSRVSGQSDDPSETFLKAYMTAQQAEKLEHDNQFNAALAKYRFAGSLIEELRKAHPDWQPAIVEYRGRKVSESILRVQDKAAAEENVAGPQLPAGAPVLPQKPQPAQPTVDLKPRAPLATGAKAPPAAAVVNDTAIQEATRKLQTRVDQLEAELQQSRTKISSAENEKQSLNSRLQETKSKLDTAQQDLEKAKGAERQVRDQLTQAQDSLKKIGSTGASDAKAQQALKAEIAQLKKALTTAQEGRSAAEKERDDANTKVAEADRQRATAAKERDEANAKVTQADQRVASANKERDGALAQLKGLKDTEQRVNVLVAENSDLKQKLADAEKTVREIGADKPKKERELADVKKQVEQLQQQLAASQKQNQQYEVAMAGLRSQLDEAASQLEKTRLVGANPEETAKLTKENEMLRNIIVRERQEEARRDQAKKLMLAEFDKLQIKSDTLTQQIQLLAQPVTRLTTDELALLRQPVVSISDDNPNAVKASFTFAKKSSPPASEAQPAAQSAPASQQPNGYTMGAIFKPNVPGEVADLAMEAKESFDNGKYRSAEKLYQEILTKTPNNLYSLSNLGVVYFRTGRLKAAELTLKKAVAVAPKDEFSHTTLGIVYYRQAKFDQALTELTKSLGLNPESATAHNYLGITASQKGWQEAAEKELLAAIADNPNYADAHFNLAVIYATAQPPSRELAKQHYTLATSLGAAPDPALERLLR